MVVVFENVRLIDGLSEEAHDGVDVTVDGEFIRDIEPHVARVVKEDQVAVIRASGSTLLPGLIDCHAHYTVDASEPDGFRTHEREGVGRTLLRAAGAARRAVATGVTTARSAGAANGLDVLLRDSIQAGQVLGPRLMAAGPAITITGGHGRLFGREADGVQGLVRAVRMGVRDGADVIKVVASGAAMTTATGAGGEELTQGEIEAVVFESQRSQRKVLSHAQGSAAVINSARAGVASVEHAFLADETALEVLAASGAMLVPTLVVTDVWRLLPLASAQRARQGEIEILHRRSCETAIKLGIPVAAGTDTGVWGVTPDLLWREIALLYAHGATAMGAIKAATSTAARLLGVAGEVGAVEVGKRADLIVVDGDPLTDLSRLARPSVVMQNGAVIPPLEPRAML